MFIIVFIFVILFLAQLFLGIMSWKTRRNIPHKYAYALGSAVEVSEILEKFVKKNKDFSLRASGSIDEVAFADNNFLLINKDVIYAKDLYTNFYIIFLIHLTKPANNFLRNLYKYQNLSYVIEIIAFILGLIFLTQNLYVFFILGIVFEIVAFAITFVGLSNYNNILKGVLLDAKKYMKLDQVEEARAESLASEIKYEVFEYPFEIFWKIWQSVR